MLKRTPLYDLHKELGGRLIEFGGWEMPVQYTGIVDEHLAVRNAAGIFDISHMGEISVIGPKALPFLNRVLTNDLRKLLVGQGQYTLLLNPEGGAIDDLYVYRTASEDFLLIVNASRIETDFAWLEKQYRVFCRGATLEEPDPGLELANVSEQFGALAVQGPRVIEFIDRCFNKPVAPLKKNEISRDLSSSSAVYVSRTGYTGEDGFEVLGPAADIEMIFRNILQTGQPFGLKPAGLGARDTLRTEVCYPLYGHELDEKTSPLEAGLGVFVVFDKGDFIGREALLRQKETGLPKKLAAFKMMGKSPPPRPGYPLWIPGDQTSSGIVVSGTQSPSLGVGIGLGYLPPALAKPGTSIEVEIRGTKFPAQIAPKPLYRKPVDDRKQP